MNEHRRNLDWETAMDGYEEPEPLANGPTPGPWDFVEGDFPDDCSIAEVGRFSIVVDGQYEGTEYDEEADARLIASAPMLLDACKEAYKTIEQVSYTMTTPHPALVLLRGIRANLEHVIKDATGEAPE